MRVVAPLSVSGLAVGQNITWSLGDIGQPLMVTQIQGKPVLQIYNESGNGFTGSLAASNKSFSLPSGGWANLELDYGDNTVVLTVVYTLPNAPVSVLMGTLYSPGESIPDTPSLGNSPIGISGSVTTSNIQTLSNEGKVSGTKVVDIGDVTFTDLIDIFNNGATTWYVNQSSVKHRVINIQTSGNPLLLGLTNDTTEIQGSALIDQILNVTGATNLTGLLTAVAATLTGQIQPNQAGTVVNGSVSGNVTFLAPIWGTGLKILVVELNNYQSASVASFNLPSSITFYAGIASNLGTQTFGMFLQGGAAQNMFQFASSGTAGSSGTNSASETAMHGSNTFYGINAANQIQIGTNTGAVFAVIAIIGA